MALEPEDVETFVESLRGGKVIEIYIGPKGDDSVPFTVQQSILCQRSKYFRTALEGAFVEAGSQKLHFPDDSLPAWKYLIYFLHYAKVPRLSEEALINADNLAYYTTLTESYLLGDKYGLGAFQNEIVRAFLDTMGWGFDLEAESVEAMIHLMPTKNPLRSLVLIQTAMDVEGGHCLEYEHIESIAAVDGVFNEILICQRWYHREMAEGRPFPEHEYGKGDMKPYLVNEED